MSKKTISVVAVTARGGHLTSSGFADKNQMRRSIMQSVAEGHLHFIIVTTSGGVTIVENFKASEVLGHVE